MKDLVEAFTIFLKYGEHESAGGEECFYSYRFGSC